MNPRIRFLVLLLIPVLTFAQSPEEDEVKLKSALDWLESKLNYLYYDNSDGRWWTNTFYVNENNEVTIKHIVSDRPNTANIRDKTYTIRRFQIQDINPRSLKITDIEESRGRVVKGQMLELRTYGFQDLMHKSINNRRASSTSFLFLSFPESLIDSLSNYAEVVKSKFEEAILASTQLYAAGDESDIQSVFEVLAGEYKSINGNMWNARSVKDNVLKVDRDNGLIEYLGFDSIVMKFYYLSISSQGMQRQNLDFKESNRLWLSNEDGLEIHIDTPNSFTFGGVEFFRQ